MISGKLAELYVDLAVKDNLRKSLADAQKDLKTFQDRLERIYKSPNLVQGFQKLIADRQNTLLAAQVASANAGSKFLGSNQGVAAMQRQLDLTSRLALVRQQMAIQQAQQENAFGGSAKGVARTQKELEMQSRLKALQMQGAIQGTNQQANFVASPQGRAAVQQQMALQEKMAESQKRLVREMRVAQIGKLGAGLEGFGESLKSMSEGIGRLLPGLRTLMGAGALGGLAAAASPETWQTFTMSLQYLAATVGSMVLPTVFKLIEWIQNAAEWVWNLDSGTKETIGTWITWGAYVVGASTALRLLFGILAPFVRVLAVAAAGVMRFSTLLGFKSIAARTSAMNMALLSNATGTYTVAANTATTAVGRLSAAMKAFIVAHPWLAAIAGIGALAGLISGGFGLFGGGGGPGSPGYMTAAETVAGRRGELDWHERARGERTRADVEAEAIRRIIRPWTAAETSAYAMRMPGGPETRRDRDRASLIASGLTEERAEAIVARLSASGVRGSADRRTGVAMDIRDERRREADIMDARGRYEAMLRRSGMSVERAATAGETYVREVRAGRAPLRVPGATGAGGAAPAGGPRAFEHGANFQAQFLGIEQQWRRIQQESVSASPLEMRMRTVTIAGMEALMAAADGRALRVTGAGAGS